MAAHDSIYDHEEEAGQRPRSIRADGTGMSMNWKVILALITVLIGGGGGYTGYRLTTRDEVDRLIAENVKSIRTEAAKKHGEIDAAVESNTKAIIGLKGTIESVQTVQQKKWAREEARRVTEPIRNRAARERAYDRLLDENLKRIKSSGEPCRDVDCSR